MKRILAAIAIGCVAAQAWAGPFQAAQVSDSATWAVHANVDGFKTTQIGTHLWAKLNEGDLAAKLGALAAIMRFDPRKDLNTVTLYGKTKNPKDSVALLGGTFNEAHLLTLLKANNSYESMAHGTCTIHSWIDEKKPQEGRQYGCFHPSGRLLISPGLDMLKEALDALDGKRPTLDVPKVFGAALPADAPFFAAGANLDAMGELDPNAQVLKQASSALVALGEKDGTLTLSVLLGTRDATAASNVHAVAQGFIAMAAVNRQKDPGLARLAQSAKLGLDSTKVTLNLTFPSQDAIQLMEQAMEGMKVSIDVQNVSVEATSTDPNATKPREQAAEPRAH